MFPLAHLYDEPWDHSDFTCHNLDCGNCFYSRCVGGWILWTRYELWMMEIYTYVLKNEYIYK